MRYLFGTAILILFACGEEPKKNAPNSQSEDYISQCQLIHKEGVACLQAIDKAPNRSRLDILLDMGNCSQNNKTGALKQLKLTAGQKAILEKRLKETELLMFKSSNDCNEKQTPQELMACTINVIKAVQLILCKKFETSS